MYVMPQTRLGKWSLGLLLAVVLYPLYWSVTMLIPDSMRGLQIAVGLLVATLALASLVLAGIAIVRQKDRSILLYVIAGITLLMVLIFAIGEFFGEGH